MQYTFVQETSNNRLKRFIALLIMTILVLSSTFVAVINYLDTKDKISSESFLSRYTPDVVHNITPFKQFILGIVSGLIFLPVPAPVELTFYVGLKQGNPVLLSMGAALLGFVIGSAITYIIGWKLSKQVAYLVSTKKIYEVRRKVNKYGVYAIILLNIVPAPSDILSFSLGITRYNVKRLFFFLILSVVVKLVVIATFLYFIQ